MMGAEAVVTEGSEQSKRIIDAGGGRYLRIDAVAANVLEQVRSGRSFEEVAGELYEAGWDVSPTRVAAMYSRLEAKLAEIGATPVPDPPGYWLRTPILPVALVRPITRRATWMFDGRVALILGISAVIAYAAMWGRGGWPSLVSLGLGPAVILLVIAGFVHEFGHATASTRSGSSPSSIGFVLYWIWPSLYCDVTKTWLFTRRQRLVVDVGGVYFQMLCGAAYAAAYCFTLWAPLRTSALFVVVAALLCANPLWKMDGYWVLSDLLDIPNLSTWPVKLAAAGWRVIVGRSANWSLNRVQTATVAVLGVSRVAAVGILSVLVIQRLLNDAGIAWEEVTRSGLANGIKYTVLSGPLSTVAWRAAATALMLFGLARTLQYVVGRCISSIVKLTGKQQHLVVK